MMSDVSLKPCPFCGRGGKVVRKPFSDYFTVECQGCLATGPVSVNEEFVIKWWNHRDTIESEATE
jgi:Lar family restriction alleviation protein